MTSAEIFEQQQIEGSHWQPTSPLQLLQRRALEASMSTLDGTPQFPSVEEAMEGPYAEGWDEAMHKEIEELLQLETWEVVDALPPGRKAIGYKWALRTKHDKTGKFVKFKARLTAKGFAQRPGIDYDEVFAPVARFTSIRLLLSLATAEQLHLRQLDVTAAFPNAQLPESIYMQAPPQLGLPPGRFLKLQRALYGLKQSYSLIGKSLVR